MKVFDIAPVKFENGQMTILDQTKLPGEEVYIKIETKEDVWDAIYHLKVRGAPAIGVAAAYGLYVSTRNFEGTRVKEFREYVRQTSEYLNSARPTAVNLSWALKRCEDMLDRYIQAFDNAADGFLCTCDHCAGDQVDDAKLLLLDEAAKIRKEDEEACYARIWSFPAETGHGNINTLQCRNHRNRQVWNLSGTDLPRNRKRL